jgi:septin family protein
VKQLSIIVSTFENNPINKINRSQSEEFLQKSSTNGINSNHSTIIQLYQDTKTKIDQLNEKVQQYEKDLNERDQIIQKLVSLLFIFIYSFYQIFL